MTPISLIRAGLIAIALFTVQLPAQTGPACNRVSEGDHFKFSALIDGSPLPDCPKGKVCKP